MAIRCEWVRERILESLGEGLSEPEARSLSQHLAGCAPCREARARQEAWVHGFRRLPRVSAPPELLQRIEAEIARQEVRPRIFRLLRYAIPAAAAATILTVALLHFARPSSAPRIVVMNETQLFTAEEIAVLDSMLPNALATDSNWANDYYKALKGEW